MNFEWSTNDIATMTVTVYETNLTLNKAACAHFEDVNYVLLGIDKKTRQIGIKPVTKQELDDNIYHGRISNKSFVYDLSQEFKFDFSENQCYKYKATYDVVHAIMIVQL